MHVMFGVITLFTCGLGIFPWLIVYGFQRRAEERDYAEAMSEYHDLLAEFHAEVSLRRQREGQ